VVGASSAAVTLGVASGPGQAAAGSVLTVNALNGVAKFRNVVFNSVGTYQLSASSAGLSGAVSALFAVEPSVTVNVPGTANILLAGMPNGTKQGGRSNDTAPAESPAEVEGLPIIPGSTYTFGATGSTSRGGGYALIGAEGDSGTIVQLFTNSAENGMAQISAPAGALIGVFLDDSQPSLSTPPSALDFSTTLELNYLTLSPGLRQPFFIGSGTGTGGALRQVVAPAGATRLYLGDMDTDIWSDNTGALTVKVTRMG